MPQDNPPIISDGQPARTLRLTQAAVFGAALTLGSAAFAFYARQELTLSHYDARAHLVVARRVFDSLTPGWRQLGAVWLPLPHLAMLLPVGWTWLYQTGAVALLSSVAVLAWGLAALSAYLGRVTRSAAIALVVPLVILLNPNVLYLQSTPMTEPMLLALSFAGHEAVDRWGRQNGPFRPASAGWVLVGLVMTRYEGWLVAATLLLIAAMTAGRNRWRASAKLAFYPALAICAYLLLARASTGAWPFGMDFFVPENPSRHLPFAAAAEVVRSTIALGGRWLVLIGSAGVLAVIVGAVRTRSAEALLPLALTAVAALPLVAFFEGHPHRDRYMVPLVAATGVLAAFALAALPTRLRGLAAMVLLVGALWNQPPLSARAPMVVEAQWETPFRIGRRTVSAELARLHDGTPILASMGSLAHYMQEASAIGLNLRDFLHEGNGDLWTAALASPARYVRWILIEERAEGGDLLAQRARQDPKFLADFRRVVDGGGLALYARRDAP